MTKRLIEFNWRLVSDMMQVNLFRVAFLLERMCPVSYGLGSKFNETVSSLRSQTVHQSLISNSTSLNLNLLSSILQPKKVLMLSWILTTT